MDDFIIKKHIYKNITFILFNDYILLTPHPPYDLTSYPTRHMLNLLENMIDSVEECIILTHYQVDRNWLITSSKGNNYMDIVSKKMYLLFLRGIIIYKTNEYSSLKRSILILYFISF